MNKEKVLLITGTSKGIGKFLVGHYTNLGYQVIGCSRNKVKYSMANYQHFCLSVEDEVAVKKMFNEIRKTYNRLDILINNAGIAAMNHALLTPLKVVRGILNTNLVGTFLFCREAAKIMQKNKFGRIINFATIAVPLKLEGEAIYAASKAGIISLTEILAKELSDMGITVNVVGPTPIKTDLIRSVPEEKINSILKSQSIHRFGEFRDVANVIDFYIRPESSFITGQVIYLGGV